MTAQKVVDFVDKRDKDTMVFHGLSVGGYLTQKVLMRSPDNCSQRISHVIYDSFSKYLRKLCI